jgi:hypothetical protein
MYFRGNHLARELSIKTEGDSRFKDYDDSELHFHLGGPHDVVVKVRNSENHRDLRCEASSQFEPQAKIADALKAVLEGRVPDSEVSLEEAGEKVKQKARDVDINSYSLPWDVLPNYLKGSRRVGDWWLRILPGAKAPSPPYTPLVDPDPSKRSPRPHDHRDVVHGMADHLRDVASRLQGFKGEAYNWLKGEEYAALRHRLEDAHASAEAAMVEARRRVRLNGGR